jgi:hypothetical protein
MKACGFAIAGTIAVSGRSNGFSNTLLRIFAEVHSDD